MKEMQNIVFLKSFEMNKYGDVTKYRIKTHADILGRSMGLIMKDSSIQNRRQDTGVDYQSRISHSRSTTTSRK